MNDDEFSLIPGICWIIIAFALALALTLPGCGGGGDAQVACERIVDGKVKPCEEVL